MLATRTPLAIKTSLGPKRGLDHRAALCGPREEAVGGFGVSRPDAPAGRMREAVEGAWPE